MTATFQVRTTPHFDRLVRRLHRHHHDLAGRYTEALETLQTDPLNRRGAHNIRKLEAVRAGEGQYRLRLGRWRFRYDVIDRDVILHYCGLRREDTYE